MVLGRWASAEELTAAGRGPGRHRLQRRAGPGCADGRGRCGSRRPAAPRAAAPRRRQRRPPRAHHRNPRLPGELAQGGGNGGVEHPQVLGNRCGHRVGEHIVALQRDQQLGGAQVVVGEPGRRVSRGRHRPPASPAASAFSTAVACRVRNCRGHLRHLVGGGLAQQVAFQHPRRCRRLVLVITGHRIPDGPCLPADPGRHRRPDHRPGHGPEHGTHAPGLDAARVPTTESRRSPTSTSWRPSSPTSCSAHRDKEVLAATRY